MSELTPNQIVEQLNHHIIGQQDAKKAVAIALRNRWRRMQVKADLRQEIKPKNILMIGPTGVGKTEIARRLATLVKAPFIKVEATKFTEVGYVGRDVESIIRDLMDIAIKMVKDTAMENVKRKAEDLAEEELLDILIPPADDDEQNQQESATRQKFRKRLREGQLDETYIDISVKEQPANVEIMGPPGMEEMTTRLQDLFKNFSNEKRQTRKLMVKQAMAMITEEKSQSLIDEDEIKLRAKQQTEQHGIVFIDEIDKVAEGIETHRGGGVSREGVQRDLLPLVEGSTITTKHGLIKTDHILFIGSGAFHLSKPSDLIPELQGRLPIRVNLKPLTVEDFKRILTEPDASLTEQYIALLATENVKLEFSQSAIDKIAEISWSVNENTENIGARRLHTVLERLLEEISFSACDKEGETLLIDDKYVNDNLKDLAEDQDLSRYIL